MTSALFPMSTNITIPDMQTAKKAEDMSGQSVHLAEKDSCTAVTAFLYPSQKNMKETRASSVALALNTMKKVVKDSTANQKG